jgi:hypothetical protein
MYSTVQYCTGRVAAVYGYMVDAARSARDGQWELPIAEICTPVGRVMVKLCLVCSAAPQPLL